MSSRIRTRPLAAALFATLITAACAVPVARAADRYYPSDGDHPLRIVHYFVAPVGTALEWSITRPLAAVARVIAPFDHIDRKGFKGCSRERPARSCTNVVK